MATDYTIAILLPCARFLFDGMLASQGIISSHIYTVGSLPLAKNAQYRYSVV